MTEYYQDCFELDNEPQIRSILPTWGQGFFSQFIYHNAYSRIQYIDDIPYGQETWHDTCIRVINGLFSIRKSHYKKNRIQWDESYWQDYAVKMGVSLCRMEWSPPGRGLWAMGTDLIRKRGAMALYNCAYTDIGEDWFDDVCWIMDTLMYGAGVGFGPIRTGLQLHAPERTYRFNIPDSREGWVESVQRLLLAFRTGTSLPTFDYSRIRPAGAIIKTFGGIASGPAPLEELHETLSELCYKFIKDKTDEVKLKTDFANLVGVCVITGNVRRSAELACCEADDSVFHHLKDYKRYPDRAAWGWMSNNCIRLREDKDFESLDMVARANAEGRDLGYINMRNIPHGRIGKFDDTLRFNLRADRAHGLNPCGEIPLEHREVCNVAETIPTRCVDEKSWYDACDYATTYCSTVTLLPTHQPKTNAIINRNRRIGVSIIDYTGWKHVEGVRKVTRYMRSGYEIIRKINEHLANEAGIPVSLRVTTIKPGGTVPKLAGRQSGIGHPTFRWTLFRINVRKDTPMASVLMAAGIPYEESVYTPDTTWIFEFPVEQGPAAPASEVSVWEQAMNLVLVQREWADNAVSNTLYFKPAWHKVMEATNDWVIDNYEDDPEDTWYPHTRVFNSNQDNVEGIDQYSQYRIHQGWLEIYDPHHEENQLEAVLAAIAPMTKSVSLLPHSNKGAFKQMPQEGITREEYESRLAAISEIDWSQFFGSDGQDEKYCTGDTCVIS